MNASACMTRNSFIPKHHLNVLIDLDQQAPIAPLNQKLFHLDLIANFQVGKKR